MASKDPIPPRAPTLKVFILNRLEDASGISGTGIVAQGVMFDDGTCALRWLTEHRSTAIYASLDDVIKIHGHEGKTQVLVASKPISCDPRPSL